MNNIHAQIKTKQQLAALSNNIKKSAAYAPLIAISETFNEVLILFYDLKGKKLMTFSDWKKAGYKVKKGEKAYTFWSRPITGKQKKEKEDVKQLKSVNTENVEDEYKFFSICKLFTEDQVIKI